jgi:polyphosphate kinase 2 (PPK2 family)
MPDDKNGDLAPNGKLKRKDYERELARLHVEFVKLQQWVVHKGLKVCIVFEGRDGAGKGGTIEAMTQRVSPRIFRVVALPAPTEREKSQMYLQRYIPHLPAAGEVVIFDRSWYNRAGVERATDTAWAPWYSVRSDNKRRARLNALTHILSKIPYEELPRSKVKLPKRQERGDYNESNYPFKIVPEVF